MEGRLEQRRLVRAQRDGKIVVSAVASWLTLFQDAYVAELEHFIEWVRTGQQPQVTGIRMSEASRKAASAVSAVAGIASVRYPAGCGARRAISR